MIKLIYLCLLVINISAAQESKFHWGSKYYKAVELAAAGDFISAKKHFETYSNPFKSGSLNNLAEVFEIVLNDLFEHKITEETAQNIFKGLNENYNQEEQSLVFSYLNKASALQADYDIPFTLKGMLHLEENTYDNALAEFLKAIEINPENYLNWYFLGHTYSLKEAHNLAIEALNESIKINENCAPCYMERFNNYHNLNKLEAALNDFINAVKLDSMVAKRKWLNLKATEKLNDIGNRFMALKKYQKSIRSYRESILYDPRWIEPYLNRGIVYRLLNDHESALQDFNKVIELAPENLSAYFQLALTYIDLDNPKKAEINLIRVISHDANNAQAYFELAKIYYQQEDIDRAILYFNKTLENDPQNIWVFYWLGHCYDTKKSYNEALHWYGEFIYNAPEKYNKHKTSIQRRIKRLQRYK